MKKITFVFLAIVLSIALGGCALVERFQQAEEQYLETRVVELLEEMPQEEPKQEPPLETEQVADTAEADETEVEEPEIEEPEETEEPEEEATPNPDPTATQQPEPTVESFDPGEYLGKPAWKDEFEVVKYWVFGADDFTAATLENGRMKLVAQTEEPGWRIASTNVLNDAYVEMEFEVGKCASTDRYGIIFRVPEKVDYNQGYIFSVTCDGRYSLRLWDGIAKKSTWVKSYTASNAINDGSNQSNRLGVMTIENDIGLYINGEKVDVIEDETFAAGYFGVYINRDKTDKLTVFVDNAKYWLNPAAK